MRYESKKHSWSDERVATEYDERRFRSWLQRWKHRRDVALVLRLMRRSGAYGRVLDMPCGTARLFPELEAAGCTMVGADLSREMMRASKHRNGSGVGFVQAEGERLPFRNGAVGAVVCMRFLFHVDARMAQT